MRTIRRAVAAPGRSGSGSSPRRGDGSRSSGGPGRRAGRLLLWYPAGWRARYGGEFTKLLVAEFAEQPRSWRRGAGVMIAGSHHFENCWPGTGAHAWGQQGLVPGGVAAFCWASTLSVSSYWAHPVLLGPSG